MYILTDFSVAVCFDGAILTITHMLTMYLKTKTLLLYGNNLMVDNIYLFLGT